MQMISQGFFIKQKIFGMIFPAFPPDKRKFCRFFLKLPLT